MHQVCQVRARITRRGRYILGIACFVAALAAVGVLLGGCGGGGSTQIVPASAWTQGADATYVGRTRCRDCHATVDDQYALSAKGNNADTASSRHTGTCNACHVTGYGHPGGGQLDGSTPHLEGLGCETCHGPGSKHVAADSNADRRATITRVPPAEQTCWACHGDRHNTPDGYRPGDIYQPSVTVTAADLVGTAPGSIRGPHYATAAFLLGRKGYGIETPITSPHSRLANTCVDCHTPEISSVNGKVAHGPGALSPNLDTNRTECASCHGGRAEASTLVQAGVNALLITLGGEDPANPGQFDSNARGGLLNAYATAHGIVLTTNANPDDPYVQKYKAARYNFRYVYGDHSLGVHNPEFALRLLRDAVAMLEE